MKYRHKPVIVDAIQYTGSNTKEVEKFCGPKSNITWLLMSPMILKITTNYSEMTAGKGAWIVRGLDGELYPVNSKTFEQLYEEAY